MERKAISWDGTEIAFEVEGSGPPLVLLHGFAANRHCWREKGYVDRLVSAGRQVILIDARGHGSSGKPHHAACYADHKRAQDTIAVLNDLGLPSADLHGFSMGGWNALATARTFPSRVRSLSLNGAHGFAQSLQPFRDALGQGLKGWTAHLEQECGRVLGPRRRAQLLSNDVKALQAGVAQDRRDLASDLRDMRLPSLTLCGDDEPFLDAAKIFAEVMHGAFALLRGKNHSAAFAAKDEVCDALLDFLHELDHGRFSQVVRDQRSANTVNCDLGHARTRAYKRSKPTN
ncbi:MULTISPECIES: alpha/beta hydrolase [Rhodomicrobium]|uniref:alpha/beta fold hydrolase n=1 Tax=Rhodomicrobium TaxID=1068 RepID=UPI000B4A7F5C|nr:MULTISPECIES: alpha/beta hydrolase [Rhodomicrobium]